MHVSRPCSPNRRRSGSNANSRANEGLARLISAQQSSGTGSGNAPSSRRSKRPRNRAACGGENNRRGARGFARGRRRVDLAERIDDTGRYQLERSCCRLRTRILAHRAPGLTVVAAVAAISQTHNDATRSEGMPPKCRARACDSATHSRVGALCKFTQISWHPKV
jgi:hypothetical protein